MSRMLYFARSAFCSLVLMFGFVSVACSGPGWQSVSSICEQTALLVSRESGVPLDVLRAITLTETGRRNGKDFQSWPWTVNMEGVGKWFDDRQSARAYVDRHFSRGARSFDVGCFQINFRWHGQAFASIDEMFEPMANARYAARFLNELHSEFGDWSKAAGAYHSRTPKFAKRYSARFNRIRAKLGEWKPVEIAQADPIPQTNVIDIRLNRFPFLQGGMPDTIASLVPLSASVSATRLIDMSMTRPMVETR